MLDWTVTVGDLLTAIAIIISAAGVLYELHKDRSLRRKELADRVRRSAGLLIAKIHRWQSITHSFYAELHSFVTDADERLVDQNAVTKVRDQFWRRLWDLRAKIYDEVREEQIELSFSDLYGYDPRILEIFDQTYTILQEVDFHFFQRVLSETQENILSFEGKPDAPESAELGNLLRSTIASIGTDQRASLHHLIDPFRAELERLVRAGDSEIARRKVNFAADLQYDLLLKVLTEPDSSPEHPTSRLKCLMPHVSAAIWDFAAGGLPRAEVTSSKSGRYIQPIARLRPNPTKRRSRKG